ncbi:hypothetical protein EW146_g7723, partial [Bondarzewia mesenterica]
MTDVHPLIIEHPRTVKESSTDGSVDTCPMCKRKSGYRNLVVCLDGTSNKIGAKLYDHVEKDRGVLFDPVEDPKRGKCCPRKQLTYYSSGIGSHAATDTFILPIGAIKQWIRSAADLAFA